MHKNQVELAQGGGTSGAAVGAEAGDVGQLEERLAGEVVRSHKVVIHHDEVHHAARRDARRDRAENITLFCSVKSAIIVTTTIISIRLYPMKGC